jgi:DMSO/TMAO reductase YedYZ molybdopterin-dependent catalytic subunit
MNHETEWHSPHAHDPNPAPPDNDPTLWLDGRDGRVRLTPGDLAALPQRSVRDCYIVSTGHGTSGPFTFGGPRLVDAIDQFAGVNWTAVDVISADGFRTGLTAATLRAPSGRAALLALEIDGRSLSREAGLVRLIVPDETDDALRQVKWVREIFVR